VRLRLGLASLLGGAALATGLSACGAPPVHNSPAETALVKQIRSAVLAKGSVHIEIHRRQKGKGVEILSGDIGEKSADESILQSHDRVSIRVTPQASYFSGNAGGLESFLGLSKKAARRAGNRWVESKAGTTLYKDLFQADTMGSLPESLLPTKSDAVKLSSSTSSGVRVKVLTWTESANGTKISEVLTVPASGPPLPLTEVTDVSSAHLDQTSVFSAWGEKLHVLAPPADDVVSYSDVTPGGPFLKTE
jgi:hypothetical protein